MEAASGHRARGRRQDRHQARRWHHQHGTGPAGSASSEFFLVVGDQPSLDFGGARNPDGQGFSAFGQVVRGMDVVRTIQGTPLDSAPPQRLRTPVRICSIRVVR
jgi:peptidyl-prolyl cis-trans isomerase A (cyclophilin A)